MATLEQLRLVVASRRSVRGFDGSRPVTDEQVEAILGVARWAPSAGNGQPWHFLVIRDREDREWNAELYLRQLRDKSEMERAVRGQGRLGGAGFRNAPVHVLVLGDPRVRSSYPVRTALDKAERHLTAGLAGATLLIMLAATTLGLATQYLSDANSPYMGTMLRVRYGIPDFFEVFELIPIGWPAKPLPATPRRPLEEMLHRGRFDPSRLLSAKELKEYLWQNSRLGGFGKGPATSAIRWDDALHEWW
jgi:nitroreductase